MAGGTHPPSMKRWFKSKASNVNPVIMSTTLNSTINCMVDMMEKTLSSTAITTAPAALPTTNATNVSSTVTSPSQSAQPLPNPPLASLQEVLNQAMKIMTPNQGPITCCISFFLPVQWNPLSIQLTLSSLSTTIKSYDDIFSFTNLKRWLFFQERVRSRLWRMVIIQCHIYIYIY